MATNIAFRANVNFDDETSRQAAYETVQPALNALLPEELVQFNGEVPSMVARLLGTLPEIKELREDAAKLADFDPAHIDQLEGSALALSYAHSQCVATAQASDDLVELNMEATGTVAKFHMDANSLAFRKLIDPTSLRGFTGATGYKNVATDLLLLVSVFRGNWDAIRGKTACTTEELDRAEKLATRMLRLVGLREQAPALTAAWSDTRTRAFTLLLRHYDAVRRAVAYLRWNQGDADAIAPSLYAGRNTKSVNSDAEAPQDPAAPPAPPAPPAAQPEAPVAPRAPAAAVPGGSPFMQ